MHDDEHYFSDISDSTYAYNQVFPNIVLSGQLQATSHAPNLVCAQPLSRSMNATCTATSGMQLQQAVYLIAHYDLSYIIVL